LHDNKTNIVNIAAASFGAAAIVFWKNQRADSTAQSTQQRLEKTQAGGAEA
jgi:hypothetical protein